MKKKKTIKFAVLMGDGKPYYRVTEIARHPKNFSGNDWVVVAEDELEKNSFLSPHEIKNYQIVYSPEK